MAAMLGRSPRPRSIVRAVALGLALWGASLSAQEVPAPVVAPILTLDQNRFFLESDFGRAVVDGERMAKAELDQENKRIEAELVAEEKALTEQRKTLSSEEFSARATAFDEKVVRIRGEQDAKSRVLVEKRDVERKEFLRLAVPVLDEILQERKATAILDQGMVIRSVPAVDITDDAIAKLNAAVAGGTAAP